MPALKIVFAGTPEFAARHLQALIASEHEIVAVYTQPDRPAGRGKKLAASPVKTMALANGLEVLQPQSLKKDAAQAQFAELNCDLMVVVAYGLLLPQAVLDAPRFGCINVHASLLPRWRGAAPIQRAIEAGDAKTGVTIMQMDIGLDTGAMLLKRECFISETDNAASLHDKLSQIGPPALLETLENIRERQGERQDDTQANYARKIDKHEAQICWDESAELIARKIRAFNPFPMSFTFLGDERLRIHAARVIHHSGHHGDAGKLIVSANQLLVACGEGQIALESVQAPGKKAMQAAAFINGFAKLLPKEGETLRLGAS